MMDLKYLLLITAIDSLHTDVKKAEEMFAKTGTTLELGEAAPGESSDIRWKKGKIKLNFSRVPRRVTLLQNGALRLSNVSNVDTGTYTREIFQRDGKRIRFDEYKLTVMDPVSTPVVEYNCSSPGYPQFHCSVQTGDQVSYHWNISTHTEAVFPRREGLATIICTAENPVSVEHSLPINVTCSDMENVAVNVVGVMILILILSSLTVTACWIYKRKHQQHTITDAGSGEASSLQENEQNQIVYSDIRLSIKQN